MLPCGSYTFGETEDYLVNIYNPCAALITLQSTADDYSSGIVSKRASAILGNIVASNKITGTANVLYEASDVNLSPGFRSEQGTVFTARTGGCN